MTKEDIILMFHEAGESAGWKPGVGNPLVINYLTHFAALVAAAERDRMCELFGLSKELARESAKGNEAD